MLGKSKPGNESAADGKPEPDYDDLPRGESNPMWEVAIAIGLLLISLAAIITFS